MFQCEVPSEKQNTAQTPLLCLSPPCPSSMVSSPLRYRLTPVWTEEVSWVLVVMEAPTWDHMSSVMPALSLLSIALCPIHDSTSLNAGFLILVFQ